MSAKQHQAATVTLRSKTAIGSHSSSYQDRLLVAHFAVVTFALVAAFGVWHESFLQIQTTFGLISVSVLALVLLVVIESVGYFSQRTQPWTRTRMRPLVTLVCSRSCASCGVPSVSSVMLDYICRANLLPGEPQQWLARFHQKQEQRKQKDEGLARDVTALNLHPFFVVESLSLFLFAYSPVSTKR